MNRISIHEVGPRDGLQMEETIVPLEVKIHWIEDAITSGVDVIQVGSFVRPDRVPQMADTDAIFGYFLETNRTQGRVTLSGLVLNERGVERGLDCGVEMFCMGVSASETHSRKNTGMTTEEALSSVLRMAETVRSAGKKVQVSVQSAFGCGFEGPIAKGRVLEIVRIYLEAGLRAISLADTAGHAQPELVQDMYSAIREMDPSVEMACHFHNTYGLGLANCYAALNNGVTSFESAFGGLGGCPFTRVPAGSVCTEDLVHSLQRMGLRQDIRLDVLLDVARQVGTFFNRELPGLILKSGSIVGFQGAQ